MMLEVVSLLCLICSGIPCAMFLWNITLYRRLPIAGKRSTDNAIRLSVLIPARDEEKNIEASLRSIISNDLRGYEVIVMNDHSTDDTAAIVTRLAADHRQLRLVDAPPLPAGWCGKQHACYQLAQLAQGEMLVFLDADVRLSPDALQRMTAFMDSNKAALASGVPHQLFTNVADRLLLPLIHFVLLGFLPVWAMRRSKMASMSGGCGQLFIAQRRAYEACGGHSMLRGSLHDGLKLPRVFRNAGFSTDLFDATDIASCRMYSSNEETMHGLGKNAHEGLGAQRTIIPMTIMLLLGQVVPLAVLLGLGVVASSISWPMCVAVALSYLPRFIAVARFKQPLLSALLHPMSVLGLLAIQWKAYFRHRSGAPSDWKGRSYGDLHASAGS